jgi:hypothetical protein
MAAYPGSKANLTLTVTATSEIGAYLIKNAALEGAAAKGVTYSRVANPLGHDDESQNYYVTKITTKTQNFGTKTEPNLQTISVTREEQTKLFAQKFTNADFIGALIERELVPISSPKGYKLVAVFPASGPALLFIENGSSIYYVGRSAYSSPVSADALLIDLYGGGEAFKFKSTTVFKHKKTKVDGETVLEIDETGTETESETFTGKAKAWVDIFPGYWDDEAESYLTNGTYLWFSGLGSYNGRYDVKSGLDLTLSASLSPSASNGQFDDEDYGSEGYYDEETDSYVEGRSNFVTGGFTLSGTKVVPDITPYLDALPESLAELKSEILAGYSEE